MKFVFSKLSLPIAIIKHSYMKRILLSAVTLYLMSLPGFAQVKNKSTNAIAALREADLKKDLYAFADDHFRGREAGTLDELKAAAWLADQARAAGLAPAGEDGTYLQFYSLWRNRISSNTKLVVGNRSLSLWKDALIVETAPAHVDAPLVFITDNPADNSDFTGKAVALQLIADYNDPYAKENPRRYVLQLIRKRTAALVKQGAVAVFFTVDATLETAYRDRYGVNFERGLYDIAGGPKETALPQPPAIWLTNAVFTDIKTSTQVQLDIQVEKFSYPSVNVVAKATGTDHLLATEYVLYSGHIDHDGIRYPINNDSIYNGADDNGSVTVAMLAIGRAFHQQPGKRSVIFVWHGAEERGLLGAKWFANHPTVPQQSIVAALNADMIGRNAIDTAALMGVIPPHRNSSELVQFALDANQEGPRFKLDHSWDEANHPEGWYYRSDHVPYARVGIPALFFSSLTHPDYHTPKDEASLIDYKKLLKMTQWLYLTGWKVAQAAKRPAVEPGFKLER
jgi:hypothetical protein